MRLFLLILSLVLLCGSASADAIIGLCGTGYGTFAGGTCGALLNPNNANDPAIYNDGNYTVYRTVANGNPAIDTNYSGQTPAVMTTSAQFAGSQGWADYGAGKWISWASSISPNPGCSGTTQNIQNCSYDSLYVINFTIPVGTNLDLVWINGTWTADDAGNVVLNGVSLAANPYSAGGKLPNGDPSCGITISCGTNKYLYSFTLTQSNVAARGAAFHTGVNTLAFQVNQADDNYDGLVVDSLSGGTVPEPGTWGLFAAGALALGMLRRRRQA